MGNDLLLPGLPTELILAAYKRAPGNEIESGKFGSPESSAALAANTFGLFIDKPERLPPLPGIEASDWPARSLTLETVMRFPWSGGRHPCLDAVIVTKSLLIGVESKRFEPFRSKQAASMSQAYWRQVWGNDMKGYESSRDGVRRNDPAFAHLDAAQLIKHAFGLRTTVHRAGAFHGKKPVLYYLYAEPEIWPNGVLISNADRKRHRDEINVFSSEVANDEVGFLSCSYQQLLAGWNAHADHGINAHAAAIKGRFAP